MTDLLAKIRGRGFWEAVIRPAFYEKTRIEDISDLEPLLQKHVVRLRGWDFPHFDHRTPTHIDRNWIGQQYDWEHNKAIWRFYQSGQFAHVWSLSLDWRDESSIRPAEEGWAPGNLLGVGDTIFTFSEILQLASRLCLSEAGDDAMTIKIALHHLDGRRLYMDSHRSRWPFTQAYVASLDSYSFFESVSRDDLAANPSEIALAYSQELFNRFGWSPSMDLLRDWLGKRG